MPSSPSAQKLIPFNRPLGGEAELKNMSEALANGHLSGDGAFSRKCHAWLEQHLGAPRALLTHSCTAALEMAALLLNLRPQDEVIMPSFTFVSTANAFALRGASPTFVDVRPDTFNMDADLVEAAITERTRAICVVHYAGVAADMDAIMEIAERHNLIVVEDAAQAILAQYKGRPLGSIGHLAAFSFHETKNIQCGEGGALVVNDRQFVDRAETIREKGTNRRAFLEGRVDKYSWMDIGSSFLPSELNAAYLWAQLQRADEITSMRKTAWKAYFDALQPMAETGLLRLPVTPNECSGNGHIFAILMRSANARRALLRHLHEHNVSAQFHYVPLHSSPMGSKVGRAAGPMSVTEDISARLVRLPMWAGLSKEDVSRIVASITQFARDWRGDEPRAGEARAGD